MANNTLTYERDMLFILMKLPACSFFGNLKNLTIKSFYLNCSKQLDNFSKSNKTHFLLLISNFVN